MSGGQPSHGLSRVGAGLDGSGVGERERERGKRCGMLKRQERHGSGRIKSPSVSFERRVGLVLPSSVSYTYT